MNNPFLLRYKIGLGISLLLLVVYFSIPLIAQKLLTNTLIDASYTQIIMSTPHWSKNGLGLNINELKASGNSLPKLQLNDFDVSMLFSKLFEGVIYLQVSVKTLHGKVAITFIRQLGQTSSEFQTNIENISIAEVIKIIPQEQIPTALAHLKLTANVSLQVSSQWDKDGALKAKYNTSLRMNDMFLESTKGMALLSMDRLNISGLVFDAYTSNLTVQTIDLENTNLAPHTRPSKSLASFKGLNIKSLSLSDFKDLTITDLSLNGANVQLLKNKKEQFQAWNQFSEAIKHKTVAKKEGETSPPFHFTLAKIHGENLEINFQDLSKTPEILIPILVKKLAVTDVSNAPKSGHAKWNANGDIFQLGTWQGSGAMNVINIDAYSNSHIVGKNINLSPFSGYTAESFGQGLKAGNLDLDLTVLIEKKELKTNGEIFARKLAFTTIENVSKIKDSFVPIDTALDVLRDGDSNIKLTIASEGSLDDPSFDVGGIWNKVLLEASKSSAMYVLGQALQPYALAFTAGKFLYDQSQKIHLEPIVFEIADANLTRAKPNADDYAKKIIALIHNKPQLVLEICPKYTNEEKLSGVQLSAKRTEVLVNYLIQHGLDASHITKCLPALNEAKKAKPILDLHLI
ncbi:MAG: DUF748 domain-containing protein [Ghiorsea sp.]